MARESAYGRLIRHFQEHPRGRLHEFFFWVAIGVVCGVAGFFGDRIGIALPFRLILGVLALCFVGWGLLPHPRQKAEAPLPKGKRGEIAKKVRESKKERRRRDDGPPPPPIRRG